MSDSNENSNNQEGRSGFRSDGQRGPGRGGNGPRGGGQRGGGRGPGRRGGRNEERESDSNVPDVTEKVIYINRSSKVVKGGRRFSFSALVVVGDHKGQVGLGSGKANEVAEAIRKGGEVARRNMLTVSLDGHTIPHEILSNFDGASVILRPASEGTGIIAGKTVRAVLESAGVRNILSKSLGSKNAANVAKATLQALTRLRDREQIFKLRGIASKKPATTTEVAAAPTA